MKKQFLTLSQFAQLLANITLSTFAQVESVTEPYLLKKNRKTGEPLPFAKVLNCRDLNIQLNYNYERQVTGRDEKQTGETSNFEAQEHKWARKITGALARHKDYIIDAISVDFNCLDTSKLYMPYVKVRVDGQKYIADGQEVAKSVLLPFMPDKDNSYQSQPQDSKVKVEYMKLASIKTFICNATEYQIVG
jgi:hypothetical protein